MKRNTSTISYSLIKSSRKSISIIVHPDGSVVVRAPKRVSESMIQDVLNKRMDWIIKHKKKFEEQRLINPKSEFVSGEKHFFLGKEYVLRVNCNSTNIDTINSVTKNGVFIDVCCYDSSMVEELMQQWHLAKAKDVFPLIVTPIVQKFRDKYDVEPTKISVKNMKSRWGSCSAKGSISINSKLIQTPIRCIEYVMVHELCYLIHFNHSKNFYSLLAEVMPDWNDRKNELRTILPYGC